jgi:hypothetical protein
VIQSCRQERLDRTLIFNQAHLLRAYREGVPIVLTGRE